MKFTITKTFLFQDLLKIMITYRNGERPAEVCDFLESDLGLTVAYYRNTPSRQEAIIEILQLEETSLEELLSKLRKKYDSGAGSKDSAKAE